MHLFGSLTSKKNSDRKQTTNSPTMATIIAHCGVPPFTTLVEPQRGQINCPIIGLTGMGGGGGGW
jgi:hypothetical protein